MKRLRLLLVTLIAVILGLDALLWHLDPLGLRRYQQDWYLLMRQSIPARDGYRFAPGLHNMEGFDVSIGLDGLRIVPDSSYSDCVIAVLGDSVTFGFGVNDEQTFVNLLARQFQEVQWLNGGLPAYSAANVEVQRETLAANGTIWLLFWNDDEPFRRFGRPPRVTSALGLYLSSLFGSAGPAVDPQFEQMAGELIRREDMLVFAFESNRLTNRIRQAYPDVVMLTAYSDSISPADAHPNAAGHQQIAAAMQPLVGDFVRHRCEVN